MKDVVVIGGGVIGASVVEALSKYKLDTVLIEEKDDLAKGTTKANTAIIHGGYDPEVGTLMAKYNVLGSQMYPKICKDLGVPFNNIGSFVVAVDDEELPHIEKLYKQGIQNGVLDMEILEQKNLLQMEPNLNPNAKRALWSKTAAVISPWELTFDLVEVAVINGCELLLNHKVKNIIKEKDFYTVYANDKKIETKIIVNCAGLYADDIHNMVSNDKIKINPRKGEWFVLSRAAHNLVNHVLFPCPGKMGKGVVITPTAYGNVLIGPNAIDITDKTDKSNTSAGLAFVKENAKKLILNIPYHLQLKSFAGLRAMLVGKDDFLVEEIKDAKGVFDIAGIKSPGLSSAPAIAQDIKDQIIEHLGGVALKEKVAPYQKRTVFRNLPKEEQEKLCEENPKYANKICICENIREQEILNEIHRPIGAKDRIGIKYRCRPGMGFCQGRRCHQKVEDIIKREFSSNNEENKL